MRQEKRSRIAPEERLREGRNGESGASSDGGPPPLGPLPSRHSFTPEQVAHHQRERLLAALATTVAKRGYAALTVGEIAAAAHVSRRSFYEHFATKEECFLAAFDAVADHVRSLTREAAFRQMGDGTAGDGDEWAAGLIAALRAALEFFAAEPALARLVFVESPSAGPALHRRFGEIAAAYAPYISRGRSLFVGPESTKSERNGAREGENALIGGLAFKITRQVSAEGPESLPAQLPAYAEYLLTPYLAADRAHELVREAGR